MFQTGQIALPSAQRRQCHGRLLLICGIASGVFSLLNLHTGPLSPGWIKIKIALNFNFVGDKLFFFKVRRVPGRVPGCGLST